MTTYGDLRIVGHQKLDDGTRVEGPDVAVHWPFYRNLAGLLPWFVMTALIAAHRRRAAWSLLIPVACLMVPITVLALGLSLLSSDVGGFADGLFGIPGTAVVALACLWALRAAPRGETNALFNMLAIALGVLWLAAVGVEGGMATLIGVGVFIAAVIIGLALARRCARKRKSVADFLVWLLVVNVGVLAAVSLVFTAATALFEPMGLGFMVMIAGAYTVVGAIAGMALFLVELPFLLLSLNNRYYGERFKKIIGVCDAEASGAAPTPDVTEAKEGSYETN